MAPPEKIDTKTLGKLGRFVRDQVLPKLLSLFWAHPYATSIAGCLLLASVFMASRYNQMAMLRESLLQESLDTHPPSMGPVAFWTSEMPASINDDLGSALISLQFKNEFTAELKTPIEALETECEKGCSNHLDAEQLSLFGDGPGSSRDRRQAKFFVFSFALNRESRSPLESNCEKTEERSGESSPHGNCDLGVTAHR